MSRQLGDGSVLQLTISGEGFRESVHGEEDIACVDCHANIDTFPHPALSAATRRAVTLELYTSCKDCHSEQYDSVLDSVHQKALAGGNDNAAVCTDCHNPHEQARLTDRQSGTLRGLTGTRKPAPDATMIMRPTRQRAWAAPATGAGCADGWTAMGA
jgi:hypothetical protein